MQNILRKIQISNKCPISCSFCSNHIIFAHLPVKESELFLYLKQPQPFQDCFFLFIFNFITLYFFFRLLLYPWLSWFRFFSQICWFLLMGLALAIHLQLQKGGFRFLLHLIRFLWCQSGEERGAAIDGEEQKRKRILILF